MTWFALMTARLHVAYGVFRSSQPVNPALHGFRPWITRSTPAEALGPGAPALPSASGREVADRVAQRMHLTDLARASRDADLAGLRHLGDALEGEAVDHEREAV